MLNIGDRVKGIYGPGIIIGFAGNEGVLRRTAYVKYDDINYDELIKKQLSMHSEKDFKNIKKYQEWKDRVVNRYEKEKRLLVALHGEQGMLSCPVEILLKEKEC